jgi:hypothetical protein
MSGKRIGAEAVAEKGWLGAHRWLILRRLTQSAILALFLLGPLAGIWIVKGNLNYSYTLDLCADRSLRRAAVAADRPCAGNAGAGRGGDRAGLLPAGRRARLLQLGLPGQCRHRRRRLAARPPRHQGQRPPAASDALLDTGGDAARFGGEWGRAVGTGQPGVDAAPRPDFRPRRGVDRGPRGLPVRPVRDEPRLVRPPVPGWRLLQPARPLEPAARARRQAQRLQRLHGLLRGLSGTSQPSGAEGRQGIGP